MNRIHLSNSSILKDTLLLLKEESPELSRQKEMARSLKGKKMNEVEIEDDKEGKDKKKDKKDKPKEAPSDEDTEDTSPDEKPEDKSEDKPEDKPKEKPEKKKPTTLPGAKKLEDAELPTGQKPSMKDIVQRINFVRAGASLKDEKIKRNISVWITQLTQAERESVFTTLDAIAKILLLKKSAAEAPTFADNHLDIDAKGNGGETVTTVPKQKHQSHHQKVDAKTGQVPIVVGEGVVKKLKEIDVPVKSGKTVPFGSKAHVSDLKSAVDALERIRSYQEQGSDSRHSIGLAIRALKNQLKYAEKIGFQGNPRTQPVEPMVEKEK